VGLENQNGLVGLQYTYFNEYPTGAKPLADETAILFACAPVSYANEYLALGGYTMHDANGNGYAEAGEYVALGLWVNNLGEEAATSVSAVLRSSNEYVAVTDSLAAFPDIEQGGGEVALDCLSFYVISECPNNYPLVLEVTLSSAGNTWVYPLVIHIYKPQLNVKSYLINDSEGNGNGIADPDELVTLAINVVNNGYSVADNITGWLAAENGDITMIDPVQTYGTLYEGQVLQRLYRVRVNPARKRAL
jgi:hypothetical protein